MELILYARILMKKWWIVVPAFLITLASTILLTFRQAPTYQATATMVVAPSSKVGDMKVIATNLEILSSRAQIASTYAEVASSRLIKREAVEELNISSSQAKALTIESQLRAGTNVIEITVQGNDPRLVSDVANKVIDRVTAYAEGLYEIYDLKTLDKAQPPSSPTGPNTLLNLALGAVLGLVLGAGLALLSQYLQASVGSVTNTSMPNVESVAQQQLSYAETE